jgi:hypothetical protein
LGGAAAGAYTGTAIAAPAAIASSPIVGSGEIALGAGLGAGIGAGIGAYGGYKLDEKMDEDSESKIDPYTGKPIEPTKSPNKLPSSSEQAANYQQTYDMILQDYLRRSNIAKSSEEKKPNTVPAFADGGVQSPTYDLNKRVNVANKVIPSNVPNSPTSNFAPPPALPREYNAGIAAGTATQMTGSAYAPEAPGVKPTPAYKPYTESIKAQGDAAWLQAAEAAAKPIPTEIGRDKSGKPIMEMRPGAALTPEYYQRQAAYKRGIAENRQVLDQPELGREGEKKEAFYGLNLSREQQLAKEQEARARSGIQAATGELSDVATAQYAQQGQLEALAVGAGPSLAKYNLDLATDRNLKQQLAQAAMARGSQASVQRNLANAQAAGAQEAIQTGVGASLAEQQNYQSLLAQQLQSTRAAAMQTQQNYEDLFQQRIAEGMSLTQAEQQAKMDYEKLLTNQLMGEKQIASQEWMAKKQAQSNLVGGILGAAGTVGAALASDKRAKKDIKSGEKDIENLLSAIKPYTYKYKEPNKPMRSEGKHTSVMAQDLEKSAIGKRMVSKDAEGTKIVDYAKGLPAMLAAQAHLHAKLAKLEKKISIDKKRK